MKTRFLSILAVATALAFLPACAQLSTFDSGVKADLASPAGKQLVADVFQSAVNITSAAIAKGTNVEADIAAADSLGGILEAYSTLPTSTDQLKTLTANAASTSQALTKAAPQIVDLVAKARSSGLSATDATQTVASGVYAATGFNPLGTTPAATAVTP